MMTKITKVRQTGVKLKIEFDPETKKCYGENSSVFRSYATLLARSFCSILKDEWRQVDEHIKDSIWTDLKVLLLYF